MPKEEDIGGDIVEGSVQGMEGVIRIVHDRGVEVLIGILGEIVGGEDEVRVIVVILAGALHLLGEEAELGVEVLRLAGGEIGVSVAVVVHLELALLLDEAIRICNYLNITSFFILLLYFVKITIIILSHSLSGAIESGMKLERWSFSSLVRYS